MKTGKNIFIALLLLVSFLGIAQEKDNSLQRSNDYVYEGNEKVGDDFVSAEMEYRKAVSVKPNNASGSYNLGNAYYNSGLFDEALARHVEAAENATTKQEKHKAFHNIGNVLMQQEQCKKAVEAFKNALRNNPSDDETRYNLALAKECANKQGESDEGEQDQKQDEKENEDQNQDENKEDQKDEGDNDNEDENKDKGDENEDKNDGDDKEDENGKPKDEKDEGKDGNSGDKKQRQPQKGKLSPQQVKSLLEAMNNQEKNVQDKINAKKAKGPKVKNEKDW